MTANTPIVNAGTKYVDGLSMVWGSTTTLTVASGACRDSGNTNDITISATKTLTSTTVGIGGIDVAAAGASSWYAVYVIGDSTGYNASGIIGSLSSSAPALPRGYDMYRRIGWVLTDGSSHFLAFYQYGKAENRTYYYDVVISELSGGNATSFTAIDLATSVPPIATEVLLNILFTPDGATEVAEFLPFGSSASNGIVQYGCGVAAAQQGMVTVPCALDTATPKILYKVASGDTLTAGTAGFKDYLS